MISTTSATVRPTEWPNDGPGPSQPGESISFGKSCPLCGASAEAIYPEAADYITGDTFNVMQCEGCHAAWTAPQPRNLDRYYPRTYRRYSPLVIQILKTIYRSRVKRWAGLFEHPGAALELGCGDGFMLNALRELGWKVSGTERTDEMARYARDQFGITVYVDGKEAPPVGMKFDLIVLFQVLEHLGDPLPQLERCAALLKPEGKLIIGVPNFASWQSAFGREKWFHLDVPRHLFHYSPESLSSILKRAGLTVTRVNFVSFEHDPYGWIQTIQNRLLSPAYFPLSRLTALLMRSVPPTPKDAVVFIFAAILALPSIALALVSWLFRRGALMDVVASRSR